MTFVYSLELHLVEGREGKHVEDPEGVIYVVHGLCVSAEVWKGDKPVARAGKFGHVGDVEIFKERTIIEEIEDFIGGGHIIAVSKLEAGEMWGTERDGSDVVEDECGDRWELPRTA